jgi:hypothetical protein
MAEHKFRIRQMVFFHPRDRTIGGEFQYRIRGTHEQHERAATESELRPV